ncbi:MAG: sulfotransferase family protein [Gammaproteobacteria bacterium]|nr:sulfotransferase family protein [Gammaproteobacteria bacterium]
MREYDPDLPLIAMHIPKTGGSSIKELYKQWFKTGFLPHYKRRGKLPRKHNLSRKHSAETPVVVYGHFNKRREFGIEHYYPEAKQFVTILRNPFERAVSRYFFFKKMSEKQDELRDVLLHQIPEWSMCCHFPRDVTMDNYKKMIETQFIEIGVMEHMEESIQRIAKKLNRQYEPESLKRRNVSKRDSRVPYELEEEFIEKHPLEYAVYNYVCSKYT